MVLVSKMSLKATVWTMGSGDSLTIKREGSKARLLRTYAHYRGKETGLVFHVHEDSEAGTVTISAD